MGFCRCSPSQARLLYIDQVENKWWEMMVVVFLSLEIESQRRGPDVVSRCRKSSRRDIPEEGVEGGEEKFLLGDLD